MWEICRALALLVFLREADVRSPPLLRAWQEDFRYDDSYSKLVQAVLLRDCQYDWHLLVRGLPLLTDALARVKRRFHETCPIVSTALVALEKRCQDHFSDREVAASVQQLLQAVAVNPELADTFVSADDAADNAEDDSACLPSVDVVSESVKSSVVDAMEIISDTDDGMESAHVAACEAAPCDETESESLSPPIGVDSPRGFDSPHARRKKLDHWTKHSVQVQLQPSVGHSAPATSIHWI
eukprot:s176_g31.t1